MATENTQMIIDNVDALQVRMKEMRKAQQIFATYTQEQVDKIFFAAAMAFGSFSGLDKLIVMSISPYGESTFHFRSFATR